MSSLSLALFAFVASSFRSRAALQAEILALRHQLAVFQNNAPRRLRLHRCDRLLWVVLYRFWSGWRRCLEMVQPDTVLRWHRRAFAWHWTRKSRRLSRKARSCGEHSRSNSAHAPSQPLVGCTPHSRRTAQVGDCSGAIHGGQIFASAPQTQGHAGAPSGGAAGTRPRPFDSAGGGTPPPIPATRRLARSSSPQ